MEAVVLHRVRFLDYFCPKQGQDFKPSAVPVYPNLGKVSPPRESHILNIMLIWSMNNNGIEESEKSREK